MKAWVLEYHYEDGPDGFELLGLYTSLRKARLAARAHAIENAYPPPRSRALKWERQSPTQYFGEYLATWQEEGAEGEYEQTLLHSYDIQQRPVL